MERDVKDVNQDVEQEVETTEESEVTEVSEHTEAQHQDTLQDQEPTQPQQQQKFDANFSQRLLDMQKKQREYGGFIPQQQAPQQQQSSQYQQPPTQQQPPFPNNPAMLQQLAPVIAPFVAPLAQQVQQQQEQLMQVQMQAELAKVRSEHEDFDEVAPAIPQLFESTPELFNLPNPIEYAYWIAKSQIADQNMEKVYDDAQKAAYQSKDAKKKAVTETQSGKVPEKEKTPEEQIAEEIIAAGKSDGSIF